jgi:hypothetical protein
MILSLTLTWALISQPDSTSEVQPAQGVGARPAVANVGAVGTPFANSSLHGTGHPTRFKRFPRSAPGGGQAAAMGSIATPSRPVLSPYLNLLRGGNMAANYYDVLRDQQIYNTSAQTQQISTQLRQATEARPMRQATQPFVQDYEPITPLRQRFQSSRESAGPAIANDEVVGLLRDILRELKAQRESSTPPPPPPPPARMEQEPQDQ